MCTLGEHFRQYAHALRFAFGLHGTQKFHPVVKYKHYQISIGAQASLINMQPGSVMQWLGLRSISQKSWVRILVGPKQYFSEQKILIGKLCVSAGTKKYGSREQPSHVKNTSYVDNGELPREWSLANVAPIFKKGNRVLADNSREMPIR